MKLPSFFQVLKPTLPKFKLSPAVVLTLCWLAALIWIWVKGETFTLNGFTPFADISHRWLATAVLFIIGIGWLTWKIIARLRVLEKARQEAKQNINSAIQAELDSQNRYLQHWEIKCQRYLETKRYAYVLPWYVMIGDSQSGKSHLLNAIEGLNPLYQPTLEENSTDSVYFSIFNNDHAVIFDIEGALLTQQDANPDKPQLYTKLWRHLFLWIVEKRPRQPLNGVILTLDFAHFLTLNKPERENTIARLHLRLEEIYNLTHSRLPVYVIFTKLDQLAGFTATYENIPQSTRENILGITFESLKTDEWTKELTQFWSEWCYQLNLASPHKMIESTEEKRASVFSFIRQINGAYDDVAELLQGISTHRGKRFHFIRGVYFLSTEQKGKIDDLFIQSASMQYELGKQTASTWFNRLSQPFFTQKLFEQVLFSEPHLASENALYLKDYHQRLKRFFILAGLGALAIIGGWHYFYYQNYRAGLDVLEQVKTFNHVELTDEQDNYGNLQLPMLNPIGDATFANGSYHDRLPLADMGLYQGNHIGPFVEQTYLRLLQRRFLPAIMNGLLIDLKQAPAESEEKLGLLRIMRMLDDKAGRRDEWVKTFMQKRWSQAFEGQADIQADLMRHLDYALKHTNWYGGRLAGDEELIKAYRPYQLEIEKAQKELNTLSIYQRVYQNLKIRAEEVLPAPLNLREHIGAGFDKVFIAQDEAALFIPQLLTLSGLKQYFLKQDSQLVDLTAMDSWVLNLSENTTYSDADRAEIKQRITELYLNDYTGTWRNAIHNLEIRPFETLADAITATESIMGSEQTIKKALDIVKEHTQTPNIPNTLDEKELEARLATPEYKLRMDISKQFALATSVLNTQDDKASLLQDVYQKLAGLHRYLLAIQNAPDTGKASLKAVQMRVEKKSTDPIFELQQMAKNLPDPLKRWLEQLAGQAWQSILKSALVSLETEWQDKVVKQYDRYLKGRYPFSPQSKQEVPLSEFERFFGPQGTLDNFYQQNLSAFIENGLTQEAEETLDDQTPLIRDDVLTQLDLAKRIQQTFFNAEYGMGAQFMVEPIDLSANKRRSVLNLDGQLIDFTHGGKRKVKVVWPNSGNAQVESKITLVPTEANKAPRSLSFIGPWAQIKLLQSAKAYNITPHSFDVRYQVDGGNATYRIYVDEVDNPFSNELFRQFQLPDTLY